jgi:hypothetical protein
MHCSDPLLRIRGGNVKRGIRRHIPAAFPSGPRCGSR